MAAKRDRDGAAAGSPVKRPRQSSDPVLGSASEPLRLSSFRQHLIRQEETIIFALIERAQFPQNPPVYADESGDGAAPAVRLGKECLLDYMLRETELVHARVRRYTSPDEVAFFPEVAIAAPLLLPLVDFAPTIRPNSININPKIKSLYLKKVLPAVAAPGVDARTLGSSSVADIACLQALSKRIHYGKFIAEAKFQADPETYSKLIRENDGEGLMKLLTDLAVEEKVLNRVELKASTFGQDIAGGDAPEYKVDPKVIRATYRDIVMPLTKEVQVAYLLQRLQHTQVVCAGPEGGAAHTAAKKHFPGISEANLVVLPGDRAEAVFAAVSSNTAAAGVVLLESQRQGVLKEVKQLLVSSNLKIVAEVLITDPESGTSRCIVISKQQLTSSGCDKSCVCFSTSHQSGALFRALQAFQEKGINLTSLESVPSADSAASGRIHYDFFVEFEGALEDANVREALDALEGQATFVRRVGTYPRCC
eukprot:TRINITY_DN22436_c0_g1_i1.p1 TRINITY_DN22436_c0_g1~~TRINITY_DN22436_c0_g1_i1.p1  ORF type:complete len:510 (+),score=156.90 TRINITY_DN22436_c0_g1_i1:95-1531(+)